MRMHFFTGVAPVLIALSISSAAPGQSYLLPLPSERNVEIVVNSDLYAGGQITDSLAQYVRDVAAQGYVPHLTTTAFADAAEVRDHLAARYATEGLAGAVFIGDIPTATYEIAAHTGWSYDSFPSDLYFQDLDGAWADSDGNGKYDSHTGDVAPEIWMGRMVTQPLTGLHGGRTEASLLNDYFAKNHSYRRGELAVSEDSLAYIDDDWKYSAMSWGGNLQSAVSGAVEYVWAAPATTASDYQVRLQEGYEHVLLAAHAGATYNTFKVDGAWTGGTLTSSQLEAMDPKVLFYNLFACSNADYTANGYMAGEYVFGTDYGLLSVGTTKIGSMLTFNKYFAPLGEGETFGAAWQAWWEYKANYGFSTYERDWHYGMSMIGDPLLVTQAYQPYLVWADFDQDGDADADDIDALRSHIGSNDTRYDVDGDGDCDSNDLDLLVGYLIEWSNADTAQRGVGTGMGDFNLDGIINGSDLTILAANYGAPATWAQGNANYDSIIDMTDLTILATYFGFNASVDAIPEPATMSLLALGACLPLFRRKRR